MSNKYAVVLAEQDEDTEKQEKEHPARRHVLRRGSTLHLLSEGIVRKWTVHIDDAYTSTYEQMQNEKRCCRDTVAPLDLLLLLPALQFSSIFLPLVLASSQPIYTIWSWVSLWRRSTLASAVLFLRFFVQGHPSKSHRGRAAYAVLDCSGNRHALCAALKTTKVKTRTRS